MIGDISFELGVCNGASLFAVRGTQDMKADSVVGVKNTHCHEMPLSVLFLILFQVRGTYFCCRMALFLFRDCLVKSCQ